MSTEDSNKTSGSGDQEPDFYVLPDGRYVMTAAFLRKRGHCCGNGCLHCPYDYINVPEPRRSELLRGRAGRENGSEQ